MSFRRKAYPEVADHLLNRLLGGVSGEAHAYPPPGAVREPFTFPLENAPAVDITSVHGSLNGESHAFAKGVDWELSAERTHLVWRSGGSRPDTGSVVEVSYLPRQRESRVNDLYPGSVVRTLLEAIALEMAGLYAQMDVVYRSGFIGTAEGGALDHVVSLLGVERVRAGRNMTEIEFTRARNTRGEILVPAGTRILTPDGAIEYETLADALLADGQPSARVSARDLVATNDGVPAGSLTLLSKPFVGIESVTNTNASSRLDRDESDDELRRRTQSVLAASERGTLGAIQAEIARHGVLADVTEPEAGTINVLFHDDQLSPEQRRRLEKGVDSVRPAGVRVVFVYGAPPQPVDLEIRLTTAQGLLDTDLKRIQQSVRSAVSDYFERLPAKAAGSVSKLIGLAMGVDGVEDMAIVSCTVAGSNVLNTAANELSIAGMTTRLGSLTVVDPALATVITAVVRHPRDADVPNKTAIQDALQVAVTYLNELNAAPGLEEAKRTLSWGKLALVTPTPGASVLTLSAHDAAPGGLPTAADRAPYDLQFVFTRPGGPSQIVDTEAAAPLVLASFERLSLAKVAVEVKPRTGGA